MFWRARDRRFGVVLFRSHGAFKAPGTNGKRGAVAGAGSPWRELGDAGTRGGKEPNRNRLRGLHYPTGVTPRAAARSPPPGQSNG